MKKRFVCMTLVLVLLAACAMTALADEHEHVAKFADQYKAFWNCSRNGHEKQYYRKAVCMKCAEPSWTLVKISIPYTEHEWKITSSWHWKTDHYYQYTCEICGYTTTISRSCSSCDDFDIIPNPMTEISVHDIS